MAWNGKTYDWLNNDASIALKISHLEFKVQNVGPLKFIRNYYPLATRFCLGDQI